MPMHHAKIKESYTSNDYKKVKVGVVDWYNSVIRLESENREEISKFASEIIDCWKDYTDEEVGIYSRSGDVKHNSLAPVCRKLDGKYIIDVILRNNRTSEEFPDGIFHAHPEYHNIKKEGIGLIEAMGLFILPGRLKKQLGMIAEILCGKAEYDKAELNNQDNYLYAHRNMIEELMSAGLCKNFEQAEKRVTDKVNEICKNILFNTAVFKNDEKGDRAFKKFLNKINVK